MDIRPAATLALTRDTSNGIEVLLLQRSWEAIFLPGYYVFPGGALDPEESDARRHTAGPGDTHVSQIMSLSEGGQDYMLAAVRECFEEAGILLATDRTGQLIAGDHPVHQDRRAVIRGEQPLAELCRRHQLTIPLDRLAYLSHWVTPPGPPRRFDTRFFVTVAPEDQPASHDGQETIDHLWISPSQALDDHRAGTRLLGLPTLRTLRILSDFDTTSALMRYAHANPPEAKPEAPWPALRKGKPVMLEPGAPAYDEAAKLDPEGEGSVNAEILPGRAVEIAARVRRLTAPNAGMMTGPGTNSYILGHDRFTVIDPGPDDPAHIQAILELTGGRIDRVLVTHTHQDHSPGASSLRRETGCIVAGMPAADDGLQDSAFSADEQPSHGQVLDTDAGPLKVLHTPGHASNHLCFLLTEQQMLFAGDHIMQGSTVVINPPDGDMKAYVESLYGLLAEPIRYIAPGHGFLMAQAEAVIDYLITHRLTREHKVARALKNLAPADLKALTATAYDDVPAALHGLAARSALAHLLKLEAEGRAHQQGNQWHSTGHT
ncbi:MBL fold metallo-hydrolase [Marinobacter salinisoli]|uniref:MBL fold metallo-hydrolase n=1 Tax=Marinobacter salinisoli TaxID=2769486 RepID=A0ABX7MT09_9GAMM|nr:MBL fold metallo-hydrolase [Marinobacter salinisoli]QSP95443.1 MBL fold metallo-hydrolase [Marinobacter salinisoli]